MNEYSFGTKILKTPSFCMFFLWVIISFWLFFLRPLVSFLGNTGLASGSRERACGRSS